MKQFLKENPEIRDEIAQKIRESFGMAANAYTIAAHDDDEELKK